MDSPDLALLLARATVGGFFTIAGWHKLTNGTRAAATLRTMRDLRIPWPGFNAVFVPCVEVGAGVALILGAGSMLATLLLGAICLVACALDGLRRVRDWHPIDAADWLDDFIYLPEVLLGVLLVVVLLSGPGSLSVDAWLFAPSAPPAHVTCV